MSLSVLGRRIFEGYFNCLTILSYDNNISSAARNATPFGKDEVSDSLEWWATILGTTDC
jgi:hypothetical protein